MKVSAIVLASGKSERFGQNKMLFPIDGEPIVLKSVKAFDDSTKIDEIVVCMPKDERNEFKEILSSIKTPVVFAEGGADRHESTVNGLRKAMGDIVLIHDGARCFVTKELIENIVKTYEIGFGVIPVIPSSDSLVNVQDGTEYLHRENIKCVQTPQAFERAKLLEIYESLSNNGFDLSRFTDNGAVWQTKYPIKTIDGDISNKKITYQSDCNALSCNANKAISPIEISINEEYSLSVGNGFDMHELVENRPLILGGINVPHEKGLLGVSDADVVLHALMDALLSSLSLPDIGHRFPPEDEKYKGADSTKLLANVLSELKEKGATVENASITILAQKPRLSPFIPQIKQNLSSLLGIPEQKIGLSATTTEGLGLVGREEGIACYVTCLTKTKKS